MSNIKLNQMKYTKQYWDWNNSQDDLLLMQSAMNDYVIYDKANDRMLCFGNGNVILFADRNEAVEDLYGNEVVMQVKDLSNENQLIILNQIQNGK